MTRTLELFDAHCHLAAVENAGDSPAPSAAAKEAVPPEAAVVGRLLCATRPEDWDALEQAAAAWPGSHVAVGIHPWWTGKAENPGGASQEKPGAWLDRLRKKLRRNPGAWVGEIGLDWAKQGIADKATQTEAFVRQLEIARELDRPVVIHSVRAQAEVLGLMDKSYAASTRPFILHGYSGHAAFIPAFLERGAFFTLGPRQLRLKEIAGASSRYRIIPSGRLFIESDAFLPFGCDATGVLYDSFRWAAKINDLSPAELAAIMADQIRRAFP